jgi:hypothetical protein
MKKKDCFSGGPGSEARPTPARAVTPSGNIPEQEYRQFWKPIVRCPFVDTCLSRQSDALVAFIALECFDAFLCNNWNHRKRGPRVCPPPTNNCI